MLLYSDMLFFDFFMFISANNFVFFFQIAHHQGAVQDHHHHHLVAVPQEALVLQGHLVQVPVVLLVVVVAGAETGIGLGKSLESMLISFTISQRMNNHVFSEN